MSRSAPRSLKCIFIGEESLLLQCAEIAQRYSIEILAIVSSSPRICDWATQQGIDLLPHDKALATNLHQYRYDYLFSVANLKRLPVEILHQPGRGAINFHDGPLPDYAGLNTPSWALINQEGHHGITWHLMTEQIDTGPILHQQLFPLEPGETAFSLNVRCFEAGIDSFETLVAQLIDETWVPKEQERLCQSPFTKYNRPRAGAVIHWAESAEVIYALSRGLTFNGYTNPLSHLKLLLQDEVLLVPQLNIADSSSGQSPGTIVAIDSRGLAVGTQTRDVTIPVFITLANETLDGIGLSRRYGLSVGDRLPILTDIQREMLTTRYEASAQYETRWLNELLKLEDLAITYGPQQTEESEVRHPHPTEGLTPARLYQPLAIDTRCLINNDFVSAGSWSNIEPEEIVASLLVAYLGLLAGHASGHIAFRYPQLPSTEIAVNNIATEFASSIPTQPNLHFAQHFAQYLPLRVRPCNTPWEAIENAYREIKRNKSRKPFANDIFWRYPQLSHLRQTGIHLPLSVSIEQLTDGFTMERDDGQMGGEPLGESQFSSHYSDLTIQIAPGGQELLWCYAPSQYREEFVHSMQRRFEAFVAKVVSSQGDIRWQDVSLLDDEDRQCLRNWNRTEVAYDAYTSIAQLFAQQASRTPHLDAVIVNDIGLSYQQLHDRSNQLAHYLQTLGVGPEVVVGVCLNRSHHLLIALLSILKAGGAYLPLDPTFPHERLVFMIEDANAPVLITQRSLEEQVNAAIQGYKSGGAVANQAECFSPQNQSTTVVLIDKSWPAIERHSTEDTLPTSPSSVSSSISVSPLAYIIYTSGSTGKPKGVMVEERNVLNFFVGMDRVIPHKVGDVWLAVTSLSFDISVLELLWTLCRGLTVLIYGEDGENADDESFLQDNLSAPRLEHMAEHVADPSVDPTPTLDSNHSVNPIGFSLFYFASDESEQGEADKYELLLEGAKFADTHGFEAVWTPERHFEAFGGVFPNPAITSAALATVTRNIQIRAGSCVLPLHNPVRVAEEWAVIDNLSKGRIGLSFAAGWHPNDFVLEPNHFANRKEIMLQQIETVRQLWRGEAVTLEGGNGPATIRTLPRPIQPELPTWLTAAGNPETFREAGRLGYHVLTHLLGQSKSEVASKIQIYRDAWQAEGHPGQGHVTLMLHTFIHEDMDEVKSLVRGPLTAYLRSSLFLIQKAAWTFPTFQQRASETGKTVIQLLDEEELSHEEMDALLAHAFERYFEESSLLGTPDKVRKIVKELALCGVDEIACQIDFGLPTLLVLASLPLLGRIQNEIRDEMQVAATQDFERGGQKKSLQAVQLYSASFENRSLVSPIEAAENSDFQSDRSIAAHYPFQHPIQKQALNQHKNGSTESQRAIWSIPELIQQHNVTHFQCTPSMMRMLMADKTMTDALGCLKTCLIGGEAFPQSLADDLLPHINGHLINMYGPTEATIWSATHPVISAESAIPIGKPIANTQLYIVDKALDPVPIGMPGELLIGGHGVVRGYLNRPELTAQRFIADPFQAELLQARPFQIASLHTNRLEAHPPSATLYQQTSNHKLYRTGDLARFRADGQIEFLGRQDFQVKLRGYRIELGEIEACLSKHQAVQDAVVIVREDVPHDKRLVAYLLPKKGRETLPVDSSPSDTTLRAYLTSSLPEYMIPAHFVWLDEFPLTPNKKTDRAAFPAPIGNNAIQNSPVQSSSNQKVDPQYGTELGALSRIDTASQPAWNGSVPPQSAQQTKGPEQLYSASTHNGRTIVDGQAAQIINIWQRYLNVSQIGFDDNFFSLGGHSLLAVQVHRQLCNELHLQLTIADIFRYTTVRSLCGFLQSQESSITSVQRQALDRAALRKHALGNRILGRRRR
ncbi:MAG: MupA/Atu3671 family FMN-dependent luciferase-like monooxygenase [Chloroflexota bacterium]